VCSSWIPGIGRDGFTASIVFKSEGLFEVFQFLSTNIEQGDDGIGVDSQAIGNELVIGSEGSQTKANAI
jgi:hypothetical protein